MNNACCSGFVSPLSVILAVFSHEETYSLSVVRSRTVLASPAGVRPLKYPRRFRFGFWVSRRDAEDKEARSLPSVISLTDCRHTRWRDDKANETFLSILQ